MGLYDAMKTNENLEREGIWLDLDHTRIKVGRAGGKNSKFIVAMEKVLRENKRTLDFMSDEQGRRLFNKVYAETIIFDWLAKHPDGTLDEAGREVGADHTGPRYIRKVEQPDGSFSDFNSATVAEALFNLPDLTLIIKETAEDANLFKDSLVKHIVGN